MRQTAFGCVLAFVAGCGAENPVAPEAADNTPAVAAPALALAPPPRAVDRELSEAVRRVYFHDSLLSCGVISDAERARMAADHERIRRAEGAVLSVLADQLAADVCTSPRAVQSMLKAAEAYPLHVQFRNAVRVWRDAQWLPGQKAAPQVLAKCESFFGRMEDRIAQLDTKHQAAFEAETRKQTFAYVWGWGSFDALFDYFAKYGDASDLIWMERIIAHSDEPERTEAAKRAKLLRGKLETN